MDLTQQNSPQQLPPPARERLLLSSLAEFWSLVEPLLLAARARTVCEVGIGAGEFTRLLLKFCRENSCRYAGIDARLEALPASPDSGVAAEFFHGTSLSVLPTLAPQDAYFIDGDHNYYTVAGELNLILRRPDHWPLIVLHDVCWPWGRRDQYCSPESIPAEFRHPHSRRLGVMPGRNGLSSGGFSDEASAYAYAAAEHEGGPRNGVLTAVEDFIGGQPGGEWRVVIIPAVFGLGILHAPAHCAPGLRDFIESLASQVAPLAPLLELMEGTRVELILSHLQSVREAVAIHADYRALAEHEIRLRAEYDRLLLHTNALQKAYEDLRAATAPKPSKTHGKASA